MKQKLIFAIIIFLIALAFVQILSDYINEKKQGEKTTETIKNAEYCIFIEIEDKKLYLLQDEKCIKEYSIASGMSYLPSPLGSWKIIDKGDWGEGFGGRWMGLNVPWGIYGIHGTTEQHSIGSAASQGCIRMYNDNIKELYDIVPVGTPVVIVCGSFGPFGRGFADIEPGDRGADVFAIQQRLKDLGYFGGYSSGIYEDDLKHALHSFQKDNGLEAKNTITKKDFLAMGFREFE